MMMEYGNFADLLGESLWMDGKLFAEDHYRQSQATHLTELDNVYNTINNGAFTPPQTPPYEHQPQLQPVATPPPYEMLPATNANQPSDLAYIVIPMDVPVSASEQTDVDRELAVVDELVRTCANNFVPSSPSSSSNSSSYGGCSDSSSEDYEFVDCKKVSRRRAKPYSFNDDKRSRKKEQNKNAATRYRMKKKAEVAEIQTEENALEQDKFGLESKVSDLQREIKCLKGLMKDFFKEKGLVR